jgi:hypothetical protein
LNIFKEYPEERYRPTAMTLASLRANVTQGRLGPGFTTHDVRDLAKLGHAQYPEPYYVTVRNDMQQLVKDLVQNCFMQEGVQTWAKFAAEVVDSNGVRRIDEPWTADQWIDAQVSNGLGSLPVVAPTCVRVLLYQTLSTCVHLSETKPPQLATHYLYVLPEQMTCKLGHIVANLLLCAVAIATAAEAQRQQTNHLAGGVERWLYLQQGHAPNGAHGHPVCR